MAAPQGPQPGTQGLTPSQRERQIQKLRHACGCTSGMVVMLLCLAGYMTYDLHASSHGGLVHRLLVGLGIALAGAVVGKLRDCFGHTPGWSSCYACKPRHMQG